MNQITVRASNLSSNKTKSTIMEIIAKQNGIQSFKFDETKGTITVVGSVDPVVLVTKLRKKLQAELVSVRPAKQENDRGESNRPMQYVPCPSYSAPLTQYAPVKYCIDGQPSECVIV